MSVELSDLRRRGYCGLAWCDDVHNEPVSASEVASACPTEVLIEVLVERGALDKEYRVRGHHSTDSRFVTDWLPVVGGVS